MIERSKKFTIGKKSFVVEFPNVGQILDIESMKQALTNNRYGIMAKSDIKSMYYALDVVDAVSFLTVVAPEVGKWVRTPAGTGKLIKVDDICATVELIYGNAYFHKLSEVEDLEKLKNFI